MPITEIQFKLRDLARKHEADLRSLGDRHDDAATSLYRHLPASSSGNELLAHLRSGLTKVVEHARTEARDLGASHVLAELRAIIGSQAETITIPLGKNPHAAEMARYVDNAVETTRKAIEAAGDDWKDAVEQTAFRAHTLIESETTNQYKTARDAAHAHLRSMTDAETKKLGFLVARHEEQFRASQSRDTKWYPLIGERWSASSDACRICSAADGEVRPFGFSFTLPGPTVHARCRCVRTLWVVPIPVEERAIGDEINSSMDRGDPRARIGNGKYAMGDSAEHIAEPGFLRSYTPEEERAKTTVDEFNRTVEVVASTETVDSYDTRFVAAGCDLTRYNKNPILLSCHDSRNMDKVIGTADVLVDGKRVVATMRFLPAGMSQEADKVFQLYKMKVLRGVSVGFNPLEWDDSEDDKGPNGRTRYLRTFKRWELVELSAVPVPANPDALARAIREWRSPQPEEVMDSNSNAVAPHKEDHMDIENQVVLPPEIAAVLKVATIEEAVKEIDNRNLQVEQAERKAEAAVKDAETRIAEIMAKLTEAEERASKAEKALSDRKESEIVSYVEALVKSGGLKEKAKESALRSARADFDAFRELYPIEAQPVAPMAHLFTQVLPNDEPNRAVTTFEPPTDTGRHDPITERAMKLLKDSENSEKPLAWHEAFSRAYDEVNSEMKSRKQSGSARDRV